MHARPKVCHWMPVAFLSLLISLPTAVKGEDRQPLRGLFVTAGGTPDVLSSRKAIDQLIAFARKTRTRILFVQIYRGNAAWFPSTVSDAAPYEACRKAMSEDPLAVLIRQAHAAGIEVHAWLNLLSLGSNGNAVFLKKYGPSILTRNLSPKNTLEDYKIDGQYFLEPGDPRVKDVLVTVLKEIVTTYPTLDGVQFDYIRYPDVNPHYGYTPANVERFKTDTGVREIEDQSEVWQDWKRQMVTELVHDLARTVRGLRPKMKVSTTGCMPHARALDEAFQDWPRWLDTDLVDFVTVMNYSPEPSEFGRWIVQSKKLVKNFRKINIALGAYKPQTTPGKFREEYETCTSSGAGACVVFYYASVLEKPDLVRFLKNAPGRGKVHLTQHSGD